MFLPFYTGTASRYNTSATEDKALASETSEPDASELEAHVPSVSNVSSGEDCRLFFPYWFT